MQHHEDVGEASPDHGSCIGLNSNKHFILEGYLGCQ